MGGRYFLSSALSSSLRKLRPTTLMHRNSYVCVNARRNMCVCALSGNVLRGLISIPANVQIRTVLYRVFGEV